MTSAFVADAETINGTAGTSVVVARPTGTLDGHVLVAFICCVGNATISTPAGWTSVGSQNPGGAVRGALFWKVAASEPASWTWTLGASQRNGGWVSAWSGVDTSDPIGGTFGNGSSSAGTAFALAPGGALLLTGGMRGLSMIAGVRTAGGSATTWAGSSDDERADQSTNAGSGTDISFQAQDTVYLVEDVSATYTPSWTASQSQSNAAMWGLTLNPAFVEFDGEFVNPIVEAAFGYDSTSDPDTWEWSDISSDVLEGSKIRIIKGESPDSDKVSPTSVTLTLKNLNGQYTPDNANGANFPNIQADTPLRVSVPYGYAPPTQRAVVFVESWEPSWDTSTNRPVVDVIAFGRLYAIQQNNAPQRSAMYRRMTKPTVVGFSVQDLTAFAHWSCEDGVNATQFAASQIGIEPLEITGTVNLASSSDLLGSDPLPTMTADGLVTGRLSHTATGQWAVVMAVKVPTEPGSRATLLQVECTGTAKFWRIDVVPGSPATFNLAALDADGTNILDDSMAVTEADFFDEWMIISVCVTQDGSDVDHVGSYHLSDGGFLNSGTLASRTIGAITRIRIPNLDEMSFGHLGVYVDPNFDPLNDPGTLAYTALDGDTGEQASARADRIAGEEGIDVLTIANDDDLNMFSYQMKMGPQRNATLDQLLQEPVNSDHSMLHDGGIDGKLVYIMRGSKYNRVVTMTLDNSENDLQPQFQPKLDTSKRITSSTVTRIGGSSGSYELEGARGPRNDSVNLSLENDAHLVNLAAHRVSVGSVSGMRYPQLAINLRRKPELVQQWLYCYIGSRIQAISLMATHGPNDVDVFLDGYTEIISQDTWEAIPNCSPAAPFIAPVIEDEVLGRLDTDGSALVSAVDDNDTTLTLTSTVAAMPPWITTAIHSAMFPFDIEMNGERMTITASVSHTNDPFTRSVSDGWTGGGFTYAIQGTAANYDVGGTTATIQPSATSSDRSAKVTTGSADNDCAVDWQINTLPASGTLQVGLVGRQLDDANRYVIAANIVSTGAVTLSLIERIDGSGTVIATLSVPLTIAAATFYRMRVHIAGANAYAKLWLRSETEPDFWHFGSVGTVTAIVGANTAGPFCRNETAVTTHIFTYDNFEVLSPQLLTATRSVNGVAKSHVAGSSAALWSPMRPVL